jgi:PiT family inorganic phosphate transporter
MTVAIVLALLWLAFSNGSNDVFKGVATLYGSGRTSYGKALTWATVTTTAGSLLAIQLGATLAAKFSGKGLVPDALAATPAFALTVGASAAATVLLATRVGFPISTTHAILGALLGAGLAAAPDQVKFAALGKGFVLPLLLSPVAALALTFVLYFVAARLRARSGVTAESCVCVGEAEANVAAPSGVPATTTLPVVVASAVGCAPGTRGVSARTTLDVLHFLSAGAVGFARGLNDAPKIAALAATIGSAAAFSKNGAAVLVAVAMAVGGWIGARRVAEKMSHGITGMNEGQGFSANVVTAGLVTAATFAGLPVSTTHVSVGSLFGIGASRGDARGKAIVSILLAWLVTAPAALAIAWTVAHFVH